LARKRAQRFEAIDALPKDIRELVHAYGYTVVKTAMDLGIKKPKQIKHMVETVLNEFSPTRASFSVQGTRNDMNLALLGGTPIDQTPKDS
jgi:hypothetical protein